VPRTGFDPRAHGFHFANDFVDKAVTVPGYGEVATDGRSGGMAYAALDYWFAGLPVPSHRPEDFPTRRSRRTAPAWPTTCTSGCSTASPAGAPASS
jgi:hypothetical protein